MRSVRIHILGVFSFSKKMISDTVYVTLKAKKAMLDEVQVNQLLTNILIFCFK